MKSLATDASNKQKETSLITVTIPPKKILFKKKTESYLEHKTSWSFEIKSIGHQDQCRSEFRVLRRIHQQLALPLCCPVAITYPLSLLLFREALLPDRVGELSPAAASQRECSAEAPRLSQSGEK